jgi:hypothetical protein
MTAKDFSQGQGQGSEAAAGRDRRTVTSLIHTDFALGADIASRAGGESD